VECDVFLDEMDDVVGGRLPAVELFRVDASHAFRQVEFLLITARSRQRPKTL